MTDAVYDAVVLREATDRLLTAVGKLDAEAVGEPSLLPGWTRGHVLAHLARNAEALVNVLTGARTGHRIPMYAGDGVRDADIERDAPRPLLVQLEDLRTTAARLDETAASLGPEHWGRTVELRNGLSDLAANIPFRRRVEVELHHVDLGIGCRFGDLPAEFHDRLLEYAAGTRFAGRANVPALLLRATDGRSWRTGREDGEPAEVTGSAAALAGWLTGRGDGGGLSVAHGAGLPALPALG